MLFLRASDGITMNRDRLLADAKNKALSLVEGYCAPDKPVFRPQRPIPPQIAQHAARCNRLQAFREGMSTTFVAILSFSPAAATGTT